MVCGGRAVKSAEPITAFRERDSSACISGIGVSGQRGSERRRDPTVRVPTARVSTPEEVSHARPAQNAPRPVSPTGVTNGHRPDPDPRAQAGEFLTTAQGLRLPDTDHSLKAGARGQTLLEDFHLREKIHPLRPRASRSAWCTPVVPPRTGCRVLRQRGVGDQGRIPWLEGYENRSLHAALGLHRVRDRAAKVMSSAVPPTA